MGLRFALLLACVCALAGCLPQSKNPLAPPSQAFADPRLPGVWEQRDDDGARGYFHMASREGKWLDVVDVTHRVAGKGLGADGYTALSARIGGDTFLSFKKLALDAGSRPAETFSFARYDFTWNGDLRLWLIGEKALAQAIRAGRLRGRVRGSGLSLEVLLTDSSAHLAAFVAATKPGELFDEKPLVLHRVRR